MSLLDNELSVSDFEIIDFWQDKVAENEYHRVDVKEHGKVIKLFYLPNIKDKKKLRWK